MCRLHRIESKGNALRVVVHRAVLSKCSLEDYSTVSNAYLLLFLNLIGMLKFAHLVVAGVMYLQSDMFFIS